MSCASASSSADATYSRPIVVLQRGKYRAGWQVYDPVKPGGAKLKYWQARVHGEMQKDLDKVGNGISIEVVLEKYGAVLYAGTAFYSSLAGQPAPAVPGADPEGSLPPFLKSQDTPAPEDRVARAPSPVAAPATPAFPVGARAPAARAAALPWNRG